MPDPQLSEFSHSRKIAVGAMFGRYRMEKQLGEGAMGAVFLATDTNLSNRPVALKIPKFTGNDREMELQRFRREAGIAATLSHPNLCPIYDVGELDGVHYIAMGFIDGKPLNEVLGGKPAAEKQAALLVRKIALAMQAAHDKGVVHRDLKPANIMLDARKEPVVMDFGLAKQSGGINDAAITQSGMILGTPAYMSPEQVNGETDRIGPAADVYSLGVILYELLTGQRPFQGPITAVLGQIIAKEPPPPSVHRPNLDPRLEAITLKAIAKNVNDRYSSMSAFASALVDYVKQVNTRSSIVAAKSNETLKPSDEISFSSAAALVDAARQCLEAYDYEEAVRLLDMIPARHQTEESASLANKAAKSLKEVDDLQMEIELAVEAKKYKNLVPKLERLLKLRPGHAPTRQLLKSLQTYGGNYASVVLDARGEIQPAARRQGLLAGFSGKYLAVVGTAVLAFGIGTVLIGSYLRRSNSVNPESSKTEGLTDPSSTDSDRLTPEEERKRAETDRLTALLSYPPLPKFTEVDQSVTWTPLEITSLRSTNGDLGEILPDHTLRVVDVKDGDKTYTLKTKTKLARITALKLATFTDGKAGQEQMSNIAKIEIRIGDSEPVSIGPALAEYSSWGGRAELLSSRPAELPLYPADRIQGKTWWMGLEASYNRVPRAVIFPLESPPQAAPNEDVEITIEHASSGSCLKRFQFLATDGSVDVALDPVGANRRIAQVANEVYSVVGRGLTLHVKKGDPIPEEEFALWDVHIAKDSVIGDEEMRAFAELDRLEAIILHERMDADRILAAVPFPMRIVLSSCPATASLARTIGQRSEIRELNLWGWRAGEDPAEIIKQASPNLRLITMAYRKPSQRAIEAIGEHTDVLQVHFTNTELDFDELDPIWKLPNLWDLQLVGTQKIDDAALERIPIIPSLRKIGFQQPAVSDDAIEQFRKRMPWMEVTARQADGKNRTLPPLDPNALPPTESVPGAPPPPAVAPFDATQAKKHQEAWAAYLNLPVEYTNSIGMKFRLISPGEFLMGSTPEEINEVISYRSNKDLNWKESISNEGPQHRVILSRPIYLSVHETTQAEYQNVTGKNPSYFAATGFAKEYSDKVAGMDTSRHPVEALSWFNAVEFCDHLNQLENRGASYRRIGETVEIVAGSNGYRLPTEAEWEYACRAGTTTRYWSGNTENDLKQAGWYEKNSDKRTHPVGELKPNPFGLFDMHGSVFEWVQDEWEADYFKQFEAQAARDPQGGSSGGKLRIWRGGDCYFGASNCRCAYRQGKEPKYGSAFLGVRVALSADAVRKESMVSDAQASNLDAESSSDEELIGMADDSEPDEFDPSLPPPSVVLTSPDWEWRNIRRLVNRINTDGRETSPSLASGGRLLFFARDGKPMVTARKTRRGDANEPRICRGPLSRLQGFDVNSLSVTEDGLEIVLGLSPEGSSPMETSSQGSIWLSRRTKVGESFGQPLKLTASVNATNDLRTPWISADGLTLLVSRSATGDGQTDIYQHTRPSRDAQFGPALHLGPIVNTERGDFGATLSADGLVLFRTTWIDPSDRRMGIETVMCVRPAVDQPFNRVIPLDPELEKFKPIGIKSSEDGTKIMFVARTQGDNQQMDIYAAQRVRKSP